ncbi:hypothetical protein K3H43_16390 [Aeromonas veronii]|uniref:hypothetical protein n=1 Tax=Aeromonas TaxID=642 RepID=UPI001F47821F|nr:hypothetical protein [Aeromonas veronii]MCF5728943.1 hypothetical protein [Aeromonas veronii]
MFKTIQANTELTLTIPFEIDGEPVADVHSVEWSVFNEFGQASETGMAAPEAGASSISVVIPAKANVAERGRPYTTYELAYTLVTKSGRLESSLVFQVESADAFVEPNNTLVSPLRALSILREIPNLASFAAATREDQKVALLCAHNAIASLPLNPKAFPFVRENEPFTSISQLTKEMWEQLDRRVVSDFQAAQVIEANNLLGTTEFKTLREAGVLSYTVGEVKQFLSSNRPLELGLCRDAMRRIGRYLDTARRLGRA